MRKVRKVREGWKVGKRKKGKRWKKCGGGRWEDGTRGRSNLEGGKVKKLEKGKNEGKGWARREDVLGEGK